MGTLANSNNGSIGTPNEWVTDVVWTINVVPRPLEREVIAASATEFSGFRDVLRALAEK